MITQGAASPSLLKDLLLASEEGRLHDVQSILDGGRCKVNDEDEVCTARAAPVYEGIVFVACVYVPDHLYL